MGCGVRVAELLSRQSRSAPFRTWLITRADGFGTHPERVAAVESGLESRIGLVTGEVGLFGKAAGSRNRMVVCADVGGDRLLIGSVAARRCALFTARRRPSGCRLTLEV